MADFIIILILSCIVGGIIFYLYRAKKRGETCIGCPYAKQCGSGSGSGGGCCGGGSGYRPKKKKPSSVIGRKTFLVEGMHCEHCRDKVEEIVNDIPGAAGKVDLQKGELLVSYAEPVDDELIRSRIERAGYMVKRITEK